MNQKLIHPKPVLRLRSGFDDDPRQPVRPGHRMYLPALYALQRQDHWTLGEHRAYWTSHLHLWPFAPAARRTRETTGWFVYTLKRNGFDTEEIARVLCLDPATVTHRRHGLEDAGEEVWAQQVDGPPLVSPQHPLPRVYCDGDDVPPFGYVNLPMTAAPDQPLVRQIRAAALVALHRKREARAPGSLNGAPVTAGYCPSIS
jgi:hypothetical protein